MSKLVLYDSVFGNTAQIAKIVADNLGPDTKLLPLTEATKEATQGLSHFVVGSPTRGFRPTPALMAFLKSLDKDSLKGVKVAAFDTRLDLKKVNNAFLTFMVGLFGYADKKIAKALTKLGGTEAVEHMGFFVADSEGPVAKGEQDRAAEWAKSIMR